MNQPQRSSSPGFYKLAAIAFAIISGVLFWAAATRHGLYFWAMAIITLINSIMSILKYRVLRGQQTNG